MDEFDQRCIQLFKKQNIMGWRNLPDKYILNSQAFAVFKLSILIEDFKASVKEAYRNMNILEKIFLWLCPFIMYALYVLWYIVTYWNTV